MMNIFGQILGFVAIGVSVTIYLQKKRERLLQVRLLTDALWVAHHFLVGNVTAAVTTIIAVFREVLFIKKRNIIFLIVLPILFFSTLLVTYKNFTSLLPPIASTLATFGLWNKSVKKIKLFGILVSLLMFVYGFLNNSYAVIVNEILVLSSIIVPFLNVRFQKSDFLKEENVK